MANNLRIWEANGKTNPKHTKHVAQRGGFTAIDAYQQVRNATEYFGPVGEGWGWDIAQIITTPDLIIVHLDFWWEQDGKHPARFGVTGCASLYQGKEGRPDHDCSKKAVTDGVTKALSYLGFNNDIFLGRFDDSKYVADVTKEFKAIEESQYDGFEADRDAVDLFIDRLQHATTKEELEEVRYGFMDQAKLIAARNISLAVRMKAAVIIAFQRIG